jgi:hypothetical protein
MVSGQWACVHRRCFRRNSIFRVCRCVGSAAGPGRRQLRSGRRSGGVVRRWALQSSLIKSLSSPRNSETGWQGGKLPDFVFPSLVSAATTRIDVIAWFKHLRLTPRPMTLPQGRDLSRGRLHRPHGPCSIRRGLAVAVWLDKILSNTVSILRNRDAEESAGGGVNHQQKECTVSQGKGREIVQSAFAAKRVICLRRAADDAGERE